MININGIAGSPGYGQGTAAVNRQTAPIPDKQSITDPAAEEQRFRNAQNDCESNMRALMETSAEISEDASEILSAYIEILRDESFFKKALKRVEQELTNIEYLIYDECQTVMKKFAAFDDPLLKERAVDIENVCNQLIRSLLGIQQDFILETNTQDIVVVAEDLTPTETVKMDKSKLRGFVTEKGGPTSHTVILAKALGIPAIVGVAGALDSVSDGDTMLLDAFTGTVTVNPDADKIKSFNAVSDTYKLKQEQYTKGAALPAETPDGHKVDVNVNSGDADSIASLNWENCDGIGLLRTEFLYMDHSDYPDEETQYAVYSALAANGGGKEVIIRTLDIGGDKQIAYMDLPKEENPFLGYRAIRICLDRKAVFHTQLRAILRASAHGNVKIMFPMIVSLEELREAKLCVEEAKQSLRSGNVPFNENIPVGIMIETPAAVLVSDCLAKESDFFSIGSNDLIQYMTATDRMNERVQHLYDSCNPAILRAINLVAKNAQAASIPWGICGEVASEDRLIPLWASLGVSELSVAPSMVGRVKFLVRRSDRTKLLPEMGRVLDMCEIDRIKQALDAALTRLDL